MSVVPLEMYAPGSAGKEERLDSCLHVFRAGLVSLLDGAGWANEFVNELAMFPQGARSDRVDAVVQCLNFKKEEDTYELPEW